MQSAVDDRRRSLDAYGRSRGDARGRVCRGAWLESVRRHQDGVTQCRCRSKELSFSISRPCSPGRSRRCCSPEQAVVPPALVADIAGGSLPAVINILLALKQRERTGRGSHLDISMSDNLFTFMYSALGTGMVTGKWPRNGQDTVTGGSARYR